MHNHRDQQCLPPLLSSLAESFALMGSLEEHDLERVPGNLAQDDDEFEEEIPVVSGRGEGVMEEAPSGGASAGRRNEDIALDLMKFVAMTTGYGRTTASGVGFQGTGSAAKPEEYAERLLELYGKCLRAVGGKK